MRRTTGVACVAVAAAALLLAGAGRASAHCDTIDGPVVKDARTAIEKGEITPALKWVKAEREAEVRAAFEHTLAVRALGPSARELADRFFFETLVRVHRDGEGAPYTGLKPPGTPVDAGVAAADRALDTGELGPLTGLVLGRADQGLRERFARLTAAKPHSGESIEKGRAYVAAYVEFVHYAERLLQVAGSAAHAGHEGPAMPGSPDGHEGHEGHAGHGAAGPVARAEAGVAAAPHQH